MSRVIPLGNHPVIVTVKSQAVMNWIGPILGKDICKKSRYVRKSQGFSSTNRGCVYCFSGFGSFWGTDSWVRARLGNRRRLKSSSLVQHVQIHPDLAPFLNLGSHALGYPLGFGETSSIVIKAQDQSPQLNVCCWCCGEYRSTMWLKQ